MEQKNTHNSVALVVGVTGITGMSLIEALKSPTALGGPWKVYGAARRSKPSWFPSSTVDRYISFDATDSDDTRVKLAPISHEVTHVFWVAVQVSNQREGGENEEANIHMKINQTMLSNVLNVLKSSPASRLSHITLQTGTNYYMGPIHDPSYSSQLVSNQTPFCEDMPRLPFPNFYYPLEDLVASYAPSLTYTVHRPPYILGGSSRSVYNLLLTLAAYAIICKHEGLPLRFPGNRYTWEHFSDMVDARVLAKQLIWAAVSDHTKNQAFNCTNGDLVTWKSVWKVLCEIFDVEFIPFHEDDEFDFVGFMKQKRIVWDDIVEKYGLCKTKLEEIARAEAWDILFHIDFQHICSMNKSREFGFFGYANTLKSIGMWVGKYRDMKILP